MSITVETFRARFPEFSDEEEYSDIRIELFIEDSTIHIGESESHWKGKYNYVQAYVTAHLLTVGTNTEIGDNNAKVGPINSKSAGGVSTSRAVTTKDTGEGDDFFRGTSYGQHYLSTRNACFAGVMVASYS